MTQGPHKCISRCPSQSAGEILPLVSTNPSTFLMPPDLCRHGRHQTGFYVFIFPLRCLSDLSTGIRSASEGAEERYKMKFPNSFFPCCVAAEKCVALAPGVLTLLRDFAEFSTLYSLYKYLLHSNGPPLGERLFVSLCSVIVPMHFCILALVSIHNYRRRKTYLSLCERTKGILPYAL